MARDNNNNNNNYNNNNYNNNNYNKIVDIICPFCFGLLDYIQKEEYNIISSKLPDLRNQRNYYDSQNKLLIIKDLELRDGLSFARNRTKEYITELLKQKDPYIRASIMTIIKIIKEDPYKEILINNNNNVRSSDQIISEVVDKFYDTISETIVLSVTPNNNYDYMYNNQEKI